MSSTTREQIAADLERRLSQSAFPKPFEMRNLSAIDAWCGPFGALTKAKALISLIASEPTQPVIEAMAIAIASLDDWRSVLSDFLRNAHITPEVIAAAAIVARQHQLDLPWASLNARPQGVTTIYDALDDGETIRFASPSSRLKPGPCIVIGIEKPLEQHGRAHLALEGDTFALTGLSEGWIERGRLACPAFAVVVP